MKKLSEFENEQALDMLAEIIEPATEIFSDAKVKEIFSESKIKGIAYAIKNHKKPIIQILAAMEGVPVEEYHCNALTLPARLLELLNDPDVQQLFTSQG